MDGFPFGESDFDDRVLRAQTPVLAMCFAKWCGPSQQLDPVIEEIAAEHERDFTVVKVDVDSDPIVTARYGVRGTPTLIMFKDGEPAGTKVGSLPKARILDWLDSIGH